MAVETYGASLDGVNALLFWDLAESEKPSPPDVERFIEAGGAEVSSQLGDLTLLVSAESFAARARHLVHLFAAATAEDAAHPENAGSSDRYAASLWARYQAGFEQLLADVRDARDVGTGSGGAHSFPKPAVFTRDQRF